MANSTVHCYFPEILVGLHTFLWTFVETACTQGKVAVPEQLGIYDPLTCAEFWDFVKWWHRAWVLITGEVFAASVLGTSTQFFIALMLYLAVCWEVFCAYRIRLFVLLLYVVSLAWNCLILCVSRFSAKENLRLFFYVSENKPVTAVLLRVTVCKQSLWQLEVLVCTATK